MTDFKTSILYSRVSTNDNLKNCINDLRENCVLLGDTIKTLIPGFTDHSIRHMDALWTIADSVFTSEEIKKFTIAEAFVLGASFYFHDLGMSLAATKAGIKKLKASEIYNSYVKRGTEFYKLTIDQANVIALQLCARSLHAENAMSLCTEKVPGLNKYIIEKETLRIDWSNFIGEVSASHHWSVTTIESKMGTRGVIPSPEGGDIDIAFVACALRIIDYAHINSERANYLEKLLRFDIDDESLIHWKAQESINGPSRHENKLKYASNKPIPDIEAWWLFYDMALGLDREIVAVSEYLNTKSWSKDRFSLEGVQNVKTPKGFSALVRTLNFEPIDIRFKPDSIERLVDILGGKTLYGNDQFAPLRELIQNSRDAILLRNKTDNDFENDDYSGRIIVSIDSSIPPKLIIKDNGVGMTTSVIENYLLGIASDYWNSEEFYVDFPNAKSKGFLPSGKFGIGFLSIFMIGDIIEVESERKTNPKLKLALKGLGKHGSLISSNSTGNFGTSVSISISRQDAAIYNNLEMIVKARAPMLTFPIVVKTVTQTSTIQPGWWKGTSQKELFDFIIRWETLSIGGQREEYSYFRYFRYREDVEFSSVGRFRKWPGKQPEIIDNKYRLLAIPEFGKVILCSRGIAVKSISLEGLTGIIEVEDLELTASRNQTIKWNSEEFIQNKILEIKPLIIESLNKLNIEGMITSRFEFIKKVANTYGQDVLIQSTVSWITILIPPGDSKLFSANETIQYLADKNEILISYGTGPWSTESICRNYFPSSSDLAVIFPVNDVDQPDFGSYSDKEIVFDTLPKHFSDDDDDIDKYKGAIYLTTLLKIISQSWGITENKLINSEWLRKSNKHLCANLKKLDFV